jgi:hypothetical protein
MDGLDRSRDAVFIERLHAKTLARGVPWEPTEHDGRYQAQVGEFVIEVGEGAADPEILICRPDGKALEILTPDSLGEPEQGASRRQLFAETYEGARRSGLGVDRAIEALIHALG